MSPLLIIFFISLIVHSLSIWKSSMILDTTVSKAYPQKLVMNHLYNSTTIQYITEINNKYTIRTKKSFMDDTLSDYTVLRDSYSGPTILASNPSSQSTFSAIVDISAFGNLELYIQESSDQGETWGEAFIVERNKMDDKIDRYYANIIYIKDRVFIFYPFLDKTNHGIAYITRAPNSKIFSKEKILFSLKNSNENNDIQFNVAYSETINVLHLIYEANDELYYMTSQSLGLLWSAPKLLVKNIGMDEDLSGPDFFADDKRNTLTIVYLDHNNYLTLLQSDNLGKSWGSPKVLNSDTAAIKITSCYCKTTDKVGKIYSMFISKDKKFTFSVFDTEYEEYKILDPPFEEVTNNKGDVPFIGCTGTSNKHYLKATGYLYEDGGRVASNVIEY